MRDFMRDARQERKLTMQQAADQLNVSVGYYSMLEHGQRTPSGAVAIRISKLFGVPLEKFYELA